jgi:large subunit ribosomal protein L17
MVCSLFEHETISTTVEKAKEVKPFAEKLITLAKKGTLSARRRAISLLGNRDIVSEEDGKIVKKGTVIGKLFSEIGPRYLDRPGGYTRIIPLSLRRLGDNGKLVLLQLIGEQESMPAEGKKKSKDEKAVSGPVEEVAEAEDVTEAEDEAGAEEAAENTEETGDGGEEQEK